MGVAPLAARLSDSRDGLTRCSEASAISRFAQFRRNISVKQEIKEMESPAHLRAGED